MEANKTDFSVTTIMTHRKIYHWNYYEKRTSNEYEWEKSNRVSLQNMKSPTCAYGWRLKGISTVVDVAVDAAMNSFVWIKMGEKKHV